MLWGIIMLLSVCLVFDSTGLVFSQSNPTYFQFSPAPVKGALYKPDLPQPAPRVGILVVHRTSNVMGSPACTELSKRGFMVLCLNPRSDNNEAAVKWDQIALDVKTGVNFLRKQPGIAKVLLLGGSGGGPTMSFYQAVAENGVAYCQAPQRLMKCSNDLAGLPPADGIIFRDAHPGNPVIAGVRNLNPAITNDAAIINQNRAPQIDPNLDPFSPKNGYNPQQPLNLLGLIQESLLHRPSAAHESLDRSGISKIETDRNERASQRRRAVHRAARRRGQTVSARS